MRPIRFVTLTISAFLVSLSVMSAYAATRIVAASNSSAASKAQANYTCDGTSDQSEIQSAINYVESNGGGAVTLMEGTFKCTSSFTISNGVSLKGKGDGTTILNFTSSSMINVAGNNTIEDMRVQGPSGFFIYASHVYFHRVTVKDYSSVKGAFYIYAASKLLEDFEFIKCNAINGWSHGFINSGEGTARGVTDILYSSCTAVNCGTGSPTGEPFDAWITGYDFCEADILIQNLTVDSCVASGSWESGFHFEEGARKVNVLLMNCDSYDNGRKDHPTSGIDVLTYGSGYIGGSSTMKLINCTAENNSMYGYRIMTGAKLTNCKDTGSDTGFRTTDFHDITLTNCESIAAKTNALYCISSYNITATNFKVTNSASTSNPAIIVGHKTATEYGAHDVNLNVNISGGAYSQVLCIGQAQKVTISGSISTTRSQPVSIVGSTANIITLQNLTITSQGSGSSLYGVYVANNVSNAGNVLVKNCSISDPRGTPALTYGIYNAASPKVQAQNVTVTGASTPFQNCTVTTTGDTTPPATIATVSDGTGTDIATTTSSSQLSSNWSASSDSETGITKYWYAIGTTAGGTNVTGWTNNGTLRTVTKTGLSLTAGITYYFTVKAENGVGLQSAVKNSNGQRVVAAGDTTAPSTIATVNDGTGTDISFTASRTQLSANWTSSSDSESGIAKYWYAIGTTAGGTNVLAWTNNGTPTSVTKTGLSLTVGTTYYYTVKAENGVGLQSAVRNSNGQYIKDGFIVAASTSSAASKSKAGYICTGTGDAAKIQQALTAAYNAGGGTVVLMEGVFTSTCALTVQNGVSLQGQGQGSTLLRFTGTGGHVNILGNNTISNMALTGAGHYFIKDSNVKMHNLAVTYCTFGSGAFEIYATNKVIQDVEFINCHTTNGNAYGFRNNGPGVNSKLVDLVYSSCTAVNYGNNPAPVSEWTTGFCFNESIVPLQNVTVDSCLADGFWESGFHFETLGPKENVVLKNCVSRNNGKKPSPSFGSGYMGGSQMINCTAASNSTSGFFLTPGCRATNCTDTGSSIGFKANGVDDVILTNCESIDSLKQSLSCVDSYNITTTNFKSTNPSSTNSPSIVVGSTTSATYGSYNINLDIQATGGQYPQVLCIGNSTNVFVGGSITTTQSQPVYVAGTVTDNITLNHLAITSQSSGSSIYGVYVNSNVSKAGNIVVKNSTISDPRGTPALTYGIYNAATPKAQAENVIVTGAKTPFYNCAVTTTGDTTPPTTIASVNDGFGADIDFTISTTSLSASWGTSSDSESAIARYWYAIGTTAGGTNIAGWTDNGLLTSIMKTGLSLSAGTTYYFSVKAENETGLQSTAKNSNGQYAVAGLHIASVPAGTMVIDGTTTGWTDIKGIKFGDNSGRTPSSVDNTAEVKMKWDNTNLYVLFNVKDTNLQATFTAHDSSVWQEDSVELWIDTLRNGGSMAQSDDYHIIINPLNTVFDAKPGDTSWDGAIQSAVTINGTLNNAADTDTGYIVECAIPWAKIGGFPGSGSKIGIDAAVEDEDVTTDAHEYFDLCNLTALNNPNAWAYATIDAGDTTPPAAVSSVKDGVGADVDVTSSTTTLAANWPTTTDAESGIVRYWYSIGTTAGGTNTVNWTSVNLSTYVVRANLSLTNGATYYVNVRAENGVGLQSPVRTSDGQLVKLTPGISSLIGNWKFNEGSGTMTADSSTHGNNGTINGGAQWTTGKSGSAIKFGGATDCVKITKNSIFNTTGDFSIDMWINPTSWATSENLLSNGLFRIFHRGDWAGDSIYFMLKINSTNHVGDSSWNSWAGVQTSLGVGTGKWYHLACVRSGNNMTIYLNGTKGSDLAALSGYSLDNSSLSDLLIGCFNGQVDEVRIWNRALSQADVSGLYSYPPTFSTIGSQSVYERSSLRFTIPGTQNNLTYSASPLPAGATFTPLPSGEIYSPYTSGYKFSWTPTSAQVGTYNIVFSVSNGAETYSESIPVTVKSSSLLHGPKQGLVCRGDGEWTEKAKRDYGADANPTGNPLGGGVGYNNIYVSTNATIIVDTKSGLKSALAGATAGQIVYVADDAEIDMTGEQNIGIPANVTLASGRGRNNSLGALIFSNKIETFPLFITKGDKVRVTGIRLQGPDPERRTEQMKALGSEHYYNIPNSRGIQSAYSYLTVDNCEISGWSHAGIIMDSGSNNNIHHNYIHHNQREGLGYGVCVFNGASAIVEANVFDWNRHSIAGSRGNPVNSYEARYNLVLGNANSHYFDMHGGNDISDPSVSAGGYIKIHHNTFTASDNSAVGVRGVPAEGASVYKNWAMHDTKILAANVIFRQFLDSLPGHTPYENMTVSDNWFGAVAPANKFDTTSPAAVASVYDGWKADVDVTSSTTTLAANWPTTTDAESGIAQYWYSVGTTAGGTNTVNWTSINLSTYVVRANLSLTIGTTYYVNIRAENGEGLQSAVRTSDGQLVKLSSAVSTFIGNWKFDEGSGTTTADSSTHGNNGTINGGAKWVTGKSGSAIRFDGVDDYVKISKNSIYNTTGDFSMDLWINPSKWSKVEELVSNGLFRIYHRGEGAGNRLYFLMKITDTANTGDSSWTGWGGVKTTSELSTGQWYHVACVKSGNNMAIYVNGIMERKLAALSGHTLSSASLTDLFIGKNGNYFSGTIDELRIWNKALTDADIAGLYVTPGATPLASLAIGSVDGDADADVSEGAMSGTLRVVDRNSIAIRNADSRLTGAMHTIGSQNLCCEFACIGGAQTQLDGQQYVTLPYADADQDGKVDGTDYDESNLVVAYLDEQSGRWVPMASQVDATANTVEVLADHYAIFTVLAVVPYTSINEVICYPNPCQPAQESYMRIGHIPLDARDVTIHIYSISGNLVRTLREGTGIETGVVEKMGKWDGRNESGDKVASGVYLCRIKGSCGEKTEKAAIIW